MAQTQHSNLRTFIILAVAIIAFITIPIAMPLLSNAYLYPVSHNGDIAASSQRHGIDPYLVCAIIRCESGWNAEAVSDAGAQGLMQIMPETAQTMVTFGLVDPERFPADDLSNPAVNIEYGCACLEHLSGEFATVEQVIAAYNAGLGPVRIWAANAESAGSPFVDAIEYKETRAYVTRVLVSLEGYRNSYPSLYPESE